MYADNTLTPREAVRLCALGTLASGPRRYSDLAGEIRHFTSHVLGTSIELLKYEGLVTATEGKGLEDNAVLTISEAGQEELTTLLTARIRAQSNDMNKLIMALKFRFLHLLPKDDQLDQIDLLLEAAEGEAARLQNLRDHHATDPGLLNVWLDHDIDALEQRIKWLTDMSDKLEAESA